MNEIEELIKKTERSIKVAQSLYQEGEYDFSVSRSYYAMFYITEAVLLTKGLTFSKHKGAITGFLGTFCQNGRF